MLACRCLFVLCSCDGECVMEKEELGGRKRRKMKEKCGGTWREMEGERLPVERQLKENNTND